MVFLPFPIDWETPEMAAARLRPAFLDVLAREAPEVMLALRDEVLPVYACTHDAIDEAPSAESARERHRLHEQACGRRAFFCHDRRDLGEWDVVGEAGTQDNIDSYPDLVDLRRAVEEWAISHHLFEPWVCEAALGQLQAWQDNPQRAYPRSAWPKVAEQSPQPDHLPWCFLGFIYSSPLCLRDEMRFTFDCEGWLPHFCTRSEAETRIRTAFEDTLRSHLDRIESAVRDHPAFDRSTKWHDLPKYLRWLVRYQCKRQSFSQIARQDFALGRRQTVSIPVRKLAGLIGLELRSPTRGRPGGSKDRYPRHTVR